MVFPRCDMLWVYRDRQDHLDTLGSLPHSSHRASTWPEVCEWVIQLGLADQGEDGLQDAAISSMAE